MMLVNSVTRHKKSHHGAEKDGACKAVWLEAQGVIFDLAGINGLEPKWLRTDFTDLRKVFFWRRKLLGLEKHVGGGGGRIRQKCGWWWAVGARLRNIRN